MSSAYNIYFDQRTNCPVCNNLKTTNIFKKPFKDLKIKKFLDDYYQNKIPDQILEETEYSIEKCLKCTTLYQKYIFNDEQMFHLYEKWISKEQSLRKKSTSEISTFTRYVNELEKVCKYLHKKPNEIDILEYGMGWGYWSNIAKALNFNVKGFEISKSRIINAKKKQIETINDLKKLKENKFDFIYSFAVFEHIPNPKETLELLKNLLKDNGLIYIYVPNGLFIERTFKDKNWKATKNQLHPLEHINCFNRKSLNVLCRESGLRIKYNNFLPRYKNLNSYFSEILKHIYNNTLSTGIFLEKN